MNNINKGLVTPQRHNMVNVLTAVGGTPGAPGIPIIVGIAGIGIGRCLFTKAPAFVIN